MMYDFMSDDFPADERRPYKLIRWWFLDCYYTYCRGKILSFERWGKGWMEDEHEINWAYEQCEYSYSRPIELLMLEVLTLVLNGGRYAEKAEPYHRAKINALLEEHDLHELLATLSGEERLEFESDLKLLKIL